MTDTVKRRGRKSKNTITEETTGHNAEFIQPKKRGRKPKGGKIVQHNLEFDITNEPSTNIILHLKCSLKDLNSVNKSDFEMNNEEFKINKNVECKYDSIENTTYNVGSLDNDGKTCEDNFSNNGSYFLLCIAELK